MEPGKLQAIVQETLEFCSLSIVSLFFLFHKCGATHRRTISGSIQPAGRPWWISASASLSPFHRSEKSIVKRPLPNPILPLSLFLLRPHKINLVETNSGLINFCLFTRATSQRRREHCKKRGMMQWELGETAHSTERSWRC